MKTDTHTRKDQKRRGLTYTTVTLRDFKTGQTYTEKFLVDTGATDSLVPARALRTLGIEPVGTKSYELADGSREEFLFGLAEIKFMNEITAGRVIFGPDDVEPLLGVTALESAGVVVDPVNQTLKRLPAISLK
jgi:clan AA aspartic protease